METDIYIHSHRYRNTCTHISVHKYILCVNKVLKYVYLTLLENYCRDNYDSAAPFETVLAFILYNLIRQYKPLHNFSGTIFFFFTFIYFLMINLTLKFYFGTRYSRYNQLSIMLANKFLKTIFSHNNL